MSFVKGDLSEANMCTCLYIINKNSGTSLETHHLFLFMDGPLFVVTNCFFNCIACAQNVPKQLYSRIFINLIVRYGPNIKQSHVSCLPLSL